MTPTTAVIFRTDKRGARREVAAVFPLVLHSRIEPVVLFLCYTRQDQHSGCSRAWYREATRPATRAEASQLARELRRRGYKLSVRKRWPRGQAVA